MSIARGALIVIEGCDRSGKSTQAAKLVKTLASLGHSTLLHKFPERSTQIGTTINNYLVCDQQLDDRVIHLLYSANRWEYFSKMKEQLLSGTTLIVDRYAYSGVAFSSSKEIPGMDLAWCCQPDVGLLKPDAVLYFDMPPQSALKRKGYGEERYETIQFQEKVYKIYKRLENLNKDIWKNLNADCDMEDLHKQALEAVLPLIDQVQNQPLQYLWVQNELANLSHHNNGF